MQTKPFPRLLFCLTVLGLIGTAHVAALAQGTPDTLTLQAIGSSRVRSQDMQATREEAVAAGLVNAIGQVLIDIIPQEVVGSRFALLTQVVLAQTDRYVRNYRVLTEATQGNIYHVLLEASVSVPQIKTSLKQAGLVIEKSSAPRILWCIAEKHILEPTERYWWSGQSPPEAISTAGILAQEAAVQGFRSVEPQQSQMSMGYAAELTVPEAVALAGQSGADVVVVGRAVAEAAPNTMTGSLQAFRGKIEISGYRVDTGERVAHVEQVALNGGDDPQAAGREVLVKVAGAAAGPLFQQLRNARVGVGGKGRVELAVEGTRGNIADLVRFRNVLAALPGVENVQLKEMMQDRTLISVDYPGDARALADALMLQNYDNFGISILEIGTGGIRLQLQPR